MEPLYYLVCDDALPNTLRMYDAEGRELKGVRTVKWEGGIHQIGTATVEFVKVAMGLPAAGRERDRVVEVDTTAEGQAIWGER